MRKQQMVVAARKNTNKIKSEKYDNFLQTDCHTRDDIASKRRFRMTTMNEKSRGRQSEIDHGTDEVQPQDKAREKTNQIMIIDEKGHAPQAESEHSTVEVLAQNKATGKSNQKTRSSSRSK